MYRLGFLGTRRISLIFSVIHVSQGSVATYVRCGGMSTGALHSKFPAESVSETIFKIG